MAVIPTQETALRMVATRSLRMKLVDAGYKFCAVETNGKRPIHDSWQMGQEEPEQWPMAGELNTGILCAGLRALDFDVEDKALSAQLRTMAGKHFGKLGLMRMRDNSGRFLLLYKTAENYEPKKVRYERQHGTIECLGAGQQFVAYGGHPSGVQLIWEDSEGAPHERPVENLHAISEAALQCFLADTSNVLGPLLSKPHEPAPDRMPGTAPMPEGDVEDVFSALDQIPNNDAHWDRWNEVGMAVWAATGGKGFGIWLGWSRQSGKHSDHECSLRWQHFDRHPPSHLGINWLFKQASLANPAWEKPSTRPEKLAKQFEKLTEWCKAEGERKRAEEEAKANQQANGSTGVQLDNYHEIEVNTDARDFVEGLLQDGAFVLVYGDSNTGKTFWTTDLALHVATGKTWNNRDVEQGLVVYCALEGNEGINNRVVGWRNAHPGFQNVPFYVWREPLDLCKGNAEFLATLKSVSARRGMPIKAVVIDTVHRAMGGADENSPEGMGLFVKGVDLLRKETKATVIAIHHSGKDTSKGARGHSSLRAAVDTEIEIIADEDEKGRVLQRWAVVRKQRDMQKGDRMPFMLQQTVLGRNTRGKEISTCLVTHVHLSHSIAKNAPSLKMSARQMWLMRVLTNLLAAPTGVETTSEGRRTVSNIAFLTALVDDGYFPEDLLTGDKKKPVHEDAFKVYQKDIIPLKTANILNFNRFMIWLVK